MAYIQWNIYIAGTIGSLLLSVTEICPLYEGFIIFRTLFVKSLIGCILLRKLMEVEEKSVHVFYEDKQESGST